VTAVRDSSLVLKQFSAVDPYIRQMIVRRMLEEHGIEPSFPVIASLLELTEMQKGSSIDISKEWMAERTADTVFLHRRAAQNGFEFVVNDVTTVTNDLFTFSIQRASGVKNKKGHDPSIEYVDAAAVDFPLTVRSWKAGDAFVPLGMKGKKKLSDLFGEMKLTSEQKASVPVIVSGESILWVAGVRLNDRFKITGKTKNIYKLSITYHGKENDRRQ
jgi:tRNA(Ile)-lysidine synthase